MDNLTINKYLNVDKKESDLIYQFAFLGKEETREKMFNDLKDLAEKEKWTSAHSSRENDILFSYIIFTFEKSAYEELILISKDEKYACFNTGLLTENGEDILCLFNEFDSDEFHWHLNGFKKASDWDIMNNFSKTPEVVSYFNDPSTIYFDPRKELVYNFDHILDDNINRFPEELRNKGKDYISALLKDAINLTLTRCKRNYRIAVPQYYRQNITYLLPVTLDNHLMSVAVEEINGRYRVNTVFTIDMAYRNARLLMKPEVDWLSPAVKKKSE